MKPQKGFIPIVLAIVIGVIAVAMVGVGIYYKIENDKQKNTNQETKTSSCSSVCKQHGYAKGICQREGSSLDSLNRQEANKGKNIDTIAGENVSVSGCNFSAVGAWDACYCLSSDTDTLIETNTNTNANSNTIIADTAGWKTYTNTDFGFTLKYPQDWKVVESTDPGTSVKNFDLVSSDESDYVSIYPAGWSNRGNSAFTSTLASTLGGKSVNRILVSPSQGAMPDLCYYEFPVAPAAGWVVPAANKIGNFITTPCNQTTTVKTILSTIIFTQ